MLFSRHDSCIQLMYIFEQILFYDLSIIHSLYVNNKITNSYTILNGLISKCMGPVQS